VTVHVCQLRKMRIYCLTHFGTLHRKINHDRIIIIFRGGGGHSRAAGRGALHSEAVEVVKVAVGRVTHHFHIRQPTGDGLQARLLGDRQRGVLKLRWPLWRAQQLLTRRLRLW
jgi:hypothetical protein